jgi:sugar phosphate permease
LTASIRLFTGRVAYVDALTEKQIRKEAERGEWYSFWAAASDIGDASIDPVEAKGAKAKPAALLSFTHAPTGKWKLELVAPKDTKAAVRVLKQLLGEDSVQANVRVKRD